MIDAHPPAEYYHLVQAEPQPAMPDAHEVIEIDVGKYLPPPAVSATLIVTVTPRRAPF